MKGQINQYTCRECDRNIVTIDVDEGVTPFMLACRATDGCKGMMVSGMYRVDQTLKPQFEWYQPTPKKIKKLNPEMRDHCERGGLLIRRFGQ